MSSIADTISVSAIEMHRVNVSAVRTPGLVVIEDVNWEVGTGDFWVVGGPAASGKSDLLGTAAGLLRPARGEHRLFGEDVDRLEEEAQIELRLRIGLVFANEGRLFNQLTVAENIALPCCYHGNLAPADAAPRVAEVLELAGLGEVAHRTPPSVNRNLRSRIGLARALALKPEILLLDEPLRGLDPRQSRWWIEMLISLHQGHAFYGGRPLTLAVTTETYAPWLDHARQFALAHERRWLILGGPDELRAARDPILRELLSDD
jgi:ABC-type transporter Mla maintaining outer membrane lipid asymmetry ATPase subunit MlaF